MSSPNETPSAFHKRLATRLMPGTLGSQIGIVVFQSGFEAAVMTLASFLVARWFGPSLLGQLGILLAGVQLVTLMGDGFGSGVIRFVSLDIAEDAKTAAEKGWLLSWVTVACSAVIALIVGGLLWVCADETFSRWWLLLAVALSVLRNSRGVFDALCRATRKFTLPAVAGVVCSFCIASALIYFSYRGYRVGWYMGIMCVGMVLNTAWLAFGYRSSMPVSAPGVLEQGRLIMGFLHFSMPLVFRGLIGFLFLKINIWLIGALAGDTDAGHFRLTDQFLTIPFLLVSSVLSAVAPRIAKAQADGTSHLKLFMSKIHGLMLLITAPFAAFCLINSYLLVPLFPGFGPASTMLALFGPAVLVMGPAYGCSVLIVQGGYPKVAFWLTLLPSIGNILAAFAGFYVAGSIGLVAGTAITHFFTYVITIIVAHRLFQIPFQIRLT